MQFTKADWNWVWTQYDKWWEGNQSEDCETCKQLVSYTPDWDEQQYKIQELVNKRLKHKTEILTKKTARSKK